ncbi:hypothetical protein F5148DRAFT_1186336 [Russula earlei]|uniref:Uncharacterized protein n=1 Tax=Russula earlei TaxID=71964 RepID=A0ACC0UD91_9AGAM|nr:hypothetical protein F5148DRAFT_1186336 [Russula earlei]
MKGEVLCSMVLASAASPVTTVWWQGGVVTSALLRQWCALCFPVICAFFLGGVRQHNG